MKRMRFLMLLVAAVTFGFIGCQPAVEPVGPSGEDEDVNVPSTDLSIQFANVMHLPFEVTSVDEVNVSAKVTVVNGTLTGVQLNYTVREGSEQSEPQIVNMTPSNRIGYYEGDIPAQKGSAIVKYWIMAKLTDLNGEEMEVASDMGNYIVAGSPDSGEDDKPGTGDDGPGTGGDTPDPVVDPCSFVRINEVSTGASIGEYIEIYNASSKNVNLDGVAIYKNLDYEEPLVVLSDVVLPADGYAVLSAGNVSMSLPSTCINLGTTDRGLASSRALCIELGRNAGETIYDTYTNTINPCTEATDWNTDPVELDVKFVARFTDGWYTAGIQTPGRVNLEPQTKLKHQKNVSLAVADAPYVASMGINPTNINAGDMMTLFANVYTDAYSVIQTVTCSINGAAVTLNKVTDNRYEGRYTFPTEGDYVVTTTATNADNRSYSHEHRVIVSPAGTVFASQAAVRLNEVNPNDKYIEFYNTSSNPVNLIGMYIEKNNEDILLNITDNIVLAGHSFAVLACGGKDYNSTEYLYLGSTDKGLSGKKSLCIEWMATIPEKVRIDAFCNTKDTDPRPKVTVWDDENNIESYISNYTAGRYQDGVVAIPQLANQWFIMDKTTLGCSNNTAARKGRLRNQMSTIEPVPTE